MACRDGRCLEFVSWVEAVAHETPGRSAVVDVGDDDQKISGRKTPDAVLRCSVSFLLVDYRRALRGHEEHGIRATCTGVLTFSFPGTTLSPAPNTAS